MYGSVHCASQVVRRVPSSLEQQLTEAADRLDEQGGATRMEQ
jgi:hypothetical protein